MYFDLFSLKNGCFDLNQFFTKFLWGLLFKCSKIGFGTAIGLGDTRQNVMVVRGYLIPTCLMLKFDENTPDC